MQDRVAVLSPGCGRDLTSQLMDHGLHSVADAQHWQAFVIDPGRRERGVFPVNAGRPARQYHSLGIQWSDCIPGNVVRDNLAIDLALPDAPRNEPAVLGAEVYDYDRLFLSHSRCFGMRFLTALLSGDFQVGRDLQVIACGHSVAWGLLSFL